MNSGAQPHISMCLNMTGSRHRLLAPSWRGTHTWRPHPAGRGARQTFTELGTNPLKAMMEVQLWSDAEHARIKACIQEW